MKKICVLFGGASPEHEVSCASAASVLENIDRARFDALPVGITRDGRWLLTGASPRDIENGNWEEGAVLAALSPVPGAGLVTPGGSLLPDAVFPVLHGENGEDGSVQGLLKLARIPFVGSGVAASAACMDKDFTKRICAHAGVVQARWMTLLPGEDRVDEVERAFSYPVFVKPAGTGSSVGVSKAKNRGELKAAIELALRYGKKALVEEFIDGEELEVAVLGNDTPRASGVGRIIPSREFYSYESKYVDGTSGLDLSPELGEAEEELRRLALLIYKALGCAGLARVDFFRERGTNRLIFNEINTIPGFTKISMYPKLFEKAGLPYCDLITELISLALEGEA